MTNRIRMHDERPNRYVMALYLQQKGWRRRPKRPTEHEPTYWIDPLGTCGSCPRTEEAYDLQVRRDAHGVSRIDDGGGK